jgi:hypothetical protein
MQRCIFINQSAKGYFLNSSASYYELIISGNSIVRFFDHSSIYFGDYHHVRLVATCEFELSGCQKAIPANHANEETLLGPAVYTRTLERMAVPSASVEEAKRALIEDFRKNTFPYLSSPDFPLKMAFKNAPDKNSVNRKYQASL